MRQVRATIARTIIYLYWRIDKVAIDLAYWLHWEAAGNQSGREYRRRFSSDD